MTKRFASIKVKKHWFYCCSTLHTHSRVFNNDNKSYPKMKMKRPLSLMSAALSMSDDNRYILASLSFWCSILCILSLVSTIVLYMFNMEYALIVCVKYN